MRKIKIKRTIWFLSVIMTLSVSGCVKDTYNMQLLSNKAHISPTLAFSAVNGDISLNDAVKSNDTIVYDQNKFVTLVFKKDAIIDLKLSDFAKGTITKIAIIDPFTVDLNINDVLSRISGDFMIANPIIKLTYTNSFPDSVKINLKATGKRIDKSVDLNLSPFGLVKPNLPIQQEVTATYSIDRNNSNLPARHLGLKKTWERCSGTRAWLKPPGGTYRPPWKRLVPPCPWSSRKIRSLKHRSADSGKSG